MSTPTVDRDARLQSARKMLKNYTAQRHNSPQSSQSDWSSVPAVSPLPSTSPRSPQLAPSSGKQHSRRPSRHSRQLSLSSHRESLQLLGQSDSREDRSAALASLEGRSPPSLSSPTTTIRLPDPETLSSISSLSPSPSSTPTQSPDYTSLTSPSQQQQQALSQSASLASVTPKRSSLIVASAGGRGALNLGALKEEDEDDDDNSVNHHSSPRSRRKKSSLDSLNNNPLISPPHFTTSAATKRPRPSSLFSPSPSALTSLSLQSNSNSNSSTIAIGAPLVGSPLSSAHFSPAAKSGIPALRSLSLSGAAATPIAPSSSFPAYRQRGPTNNPLNIQTSSPAPPAASSLPSRRHSLLANHISSSNSNPDMVNSRTSPSRPPLSQQQLNALSSVTRPRSSSTTSRRSSISYVLSTSPPTPSCNEPGSARKPLFPNTPPRTRQRRASTISYDSNPSLPSPKLSLDESVGRLSLDENHYHEQKDEIIFQLNATVTQLKDERENLHEDVNGWRTRCAGLEQAVRVSACALEDHKKENHLLREKVTKLSDTIAEREGGSQAELAELKAQIFRMADQISSLESSQTSLKNELKCVGNERSHLESKLTNATESLQQSKYARNEMALQLERARNEFTTQLERTKSDFSSQLEQSNTERDHLKALVHSLKSQQQHAQSIEGEDVDDVDEYDVPDLDRDSNDTHSSESYIATKHLQGEHSEQHAKLGGNEHSEDDGQDSRRHSRSTSFMQNWRMPLGPVEKKNLQSYHQETDDDGDDSFFQLFTKTVLPPLPLSETARSLPIYFDELVCDDASQPSNRKPSQQQHQQEQKRTISPRPALDRESSSSLMSYSSSSDMSLSDKSYSFRSFNQDVPPVPPAKSNTQHSLRHSPTISSRMSLQTLGSLFGSSSSTTNNNTNKLLPRTLSTPANLSNTYYFSDNHSSSISNKHALGALSEEADFVHGEQQPLRYVSTDIKSHRRPSYTPIGRLDFTLSVDVHPNDILHI